jgi:hypothetical protein
LVSGAGTPPGGAKTRKKARRARASRIIHRTSRRWP